MTRLVEFEITGGVAEARLNRPERLNAVTPALVEELCGALERAIAADVAALILAGNGSSFCSGYDLRQPPRQLPTAQERRELERIQDVTRLIRRSPHPVIAAVQGYAIGAGCEFALSCDLVVLASDAVLGFPEVDIGLSITGGATHLLPRILGGPLAKHFVLLGERIPAELAVRLGLAGSVVASEDLMPTVRAHAHRLAAMPKASLRVAKRALDRAPLTGLEEALELEVDDAIALTGVYQGRTGADEFRDRKRRSSGQPASQLLHIFVIH